MKREGENIKDINIMIEGRILILIVKMMTIELKQMSQAL